MKSIILLALIGASQNILFLGDTISETHFKNLTVPNTNSSYSDSINNRLNIVYSPLGIDINTIIYHDLYIRAIDWFGVNYEFGKNSKHGIDCSNFVKYLVEGIITNRLIGNSKEIYLQCNHIDKEMLKEGDLVFFSVNKPYISHVGIYLQNNKFIHATTIKGVIISDLNEEYYKKYYFASGRLKN